MEEKQVRCPACNGSGWTEIDDDGLPSQSCVICSTLGTLPESWANELVEMGINDTQTPTVVIEFE